MEVGAAERVLRSSYGRLIALLAARSGDVVAAEDALSDAFLAALVAWEKNGVPKNPDAWLLTAARRRLLDAHRRRATRERHAQEVEDTILELTSRTEPEAIPDERLRLLFVCTHPALDEGVQVGLMLQTVLGLDAARIASALRVAPKTMGQRLWRAKTKIRDARIPFEVPPTSELPARVGAVLEAIYAMFGAAWEDVDGTDATLHDLTTEAIFLARLLTELLPEEAEAHGLLSLMLFAEARRGARRTDSGHYVPLGQQDTTRWSRERIMEAERTLQHAFALRRIGPFQLEAAIQSAHTAAAYRGTRDLDSLLALYDGLVHLAPSLGARVARAAVLLEARGPDSALAALDEMRDEAKTEYQPFWVVRAEALCALRQSREARTAYERAIGLTEDPATRRYLQSRALAA